MFDERVGIGWTGRVILFAWSTAALFVGTAISARPVPPVVTVRDIADEGRPAQPSNEAQCPAQPARQNVLLSFPEVPSSHGSFLLMAVGTDAADAYELELRDADGRPVAPNRREKWGNVVHAVSASFASVGPGRYRAALRGAHPSQTLICHEVVIVDEPVQVASPRTGAWEIRRDWDPSMEALYSAWLAKLLYVTPGAHKGWQPLHQATRDPTRNFLYGALGREEDNVERKGGVTMMPDCADLPYHLRAYFAWKLGLPMLVNRCSRGRSDTGSNCSGTVGSTSAAFDRIADPVARFNAFVDRGLSWQVQTGNLRTAPSQLLSDTYSVALTTNALKPGTVFVDPGGHTLVLSQYEPQSRSSLGTLYGADAHPDRTITHKAFGPGTFVFNHRVSTGGFKTFRPVVRDGRGLRFLSNEEIDAEPGYAARSEEQSRFGSTEAFYNQVFSLLNPIPPDPREVLTAKIEVLYAAMKDRVLAVQLGQEYMGKQGAAAMPMPQGAEIFETNGPWETYSTPARDLRCLIAMDDAMHFPQIVADAPERYAVPPGTGALKLVSELTQLRDRLLAERIIEYERSDGSPWTLPLAEIVARQTELEMAYNPNDCPEIRWGAPQGSDELATCGRFAPKDQRLKMKMARSWFATRRRPDQR